MQWRFRNQINQIIPPLIYSDGRTQLDVINEVLEALDDNDIVHLQGAVGTGKSNIALHIISEKQKGIISVPTKNLEDQYVDDYCGNTSFKVITRIGTPMEVNNLRGRTNFRCPNPPPNLPRQRRINCGHEQLYCTRPILPTETRADIAQNCPYWSPVFDSTRIPDAFNRHNKTGYRYNSITGPKIYFEAKNPCPYYAQFKYFVPDGAIIMNSAKWEAETWIGRKPHVPIEIIDEADAFLDGLSYQTSFTTRRIGVIQRAEIFDERETNNAEIELGQLYQKYRTKGEFELDTAPDLESYINGIYMAIQDSSVPELSSLSFKLTVLLNFREYVFASANDTPNNNGFTFFIPRLDITLEELRKRSGKILLMSATSHSPENLQNIFNIAPPKLVAQEENPGTLYLMSPSKYSLQDISYRTWQKRQVRQEYHRILEHQLKIAAKPCYVLVHAHKYLPEQYKPRPDERRINYWSRYNHKDVRFSTKMDRGVDLKDEKCRSIILLKYPIPNIGDTFLKALRKQIGNDKFWKYVNDMADRDLLQQCGRAIRNKNDWCQIYSPDRKVINRLNHIWQGRLLRNKYE